MMLVDRLIIWKFKYLNLIYSNKISFYYHTMKKNIYSFIKYALRRIIIHMNFNRF